MAQGTTDKDFARIVQQETGAPYQQCLQAAEALRPLLAHAGPAPVAQAVRRSSLRLSRGRPGASDGPAEPFEFELYFEDCLEIAAHILSDSTQLAPLGDAILARADVGDGGTDLVLPLLPSPALGLPRGTDLLLEMRIRNEAPRPLATFPCADFWFSLTNATLDKGEDVLVSTDRLRPVSDWPTLPPRRPLDDPLMEFELPDVGQRAVRTFRARDGWKWEIYDMAIGARELSAGESIENIGGGPPTVLPAGLLAAVDIHSGNQHGYPLVETGGGGFVVADLRTRRTWWGVTCSNIRCTLWLAGPREQL